MKKRSFRWLIAFACLVALTSNGIIASATHTTSIEPMYVGIIRLAPEISISKTGVISCTDRVSLKNGYTADVTWELQEGKKSNLTTIATWKDSGSVALLLNRERMATKGYSYCLKTTVKAYNSNGKLVDDDIKYSKVVSY